MRCVLEPMRARWSSVCCHNVPQPSRIVLQRVVRLTSGLSSRALEQNVARREIIDTFSQHPYQGSAKQMSLESLDHGEKSFFVLNFSEVICFPAWVISNVLKTATELLRFFGSPPAFSTSLNAHLFPILQPQVHASTDR